MRSRRLELLTAAAMALAAAAPAWAEPLTRDQVDAQARALRDYPGLRGSTTSHELRAKPDDDEDQPRPRSETPAWLQWLGGVVRWFNEAGRWLVWALGAVVLAMVLVRSRVWLRLGGLQGQAGALSLPTHVRELDIRPETLPADIGAAALALWQSGQALQALSLLYRGMLSQLVHRHAVPIRASSTEGDCLRLASGRIDTQSQRYVEVLVACWRESVYASRLPADEHVRWLCQAFSRLTPTAEGPR